MEKTSSLKAGRIPEWDEWSFSPQEQTPQMANLPTREDSPQEELLSCCQETAYAERVQEYLRKDGKCEISSRGQKTRADEATLENIEELQTQEISEKGQEGQHKSEAKEKSSTAHILSSERSPKSRPSTSETIGAESQSTTLSLTGRGRKPHRFWSKMYRKDLLNPLQNTQNLKTSKILVLPVGKGGVQIIQHHLQVEALPRNPKNAMLIAVHQ